MGRSGKTLQQYALEHGQRGELLLDEYDEGNKRPVTQIAYASNKPAIWNCRHCGHRWTALVVNRTCHQSGCPKCRDTHTSGDEQIIFSLLARELVPKGYTVLNRHRIRGMEVDVYVPELRFGVEFDGAYWHRTKYRREKDEEKHNWFASANLDIVRVVESAGDTQNEGKIRCDLCFARSKDRDLQAVREYLRWYLSDKYKININCEMTEDEVFQSRQAARRTVKEEPAETV